MSRIDQVVRLSVGVLIVAAAGCLGPDDSPVERVAGRYRAEQAGDRQNLGTIEFIRVVDGQTAVEDWLERGAVFSIILESDGTTEGRLFIPGVGEDGDGSDLDEDLIGTWTLEGTVIRFSHEADTFVRDMQWTWEEDRLVGDEDFGDERVRVVLERR